MIFTRRFGALAARPVFPHITEIAQETTPDLPSTDVDAKVDAEHASAA